MIELYRNAWSQACEDAITLFHQLGDGDLGVPTDCPGWSVRDVVAHLAHIEAVLAGLVDDRSAGGPSSQVVEQYTEAGVAERRDRDFPALVDEFTRAVHTRRDQLENVTEDGPAPITPGGVDWTWEVLLRNRVVDVWMHDQDIRRAVDRPGGFDTPGAQVTATTFSHSLPLVLAKRVGAGPHTTARWIIEGPVPFDFTVEVGDDGRARFVDEPGDIDTTLRMSSEDFTILAAGRRRPDRLDVELSGDTELADRIMRNMAVTP